MRASHVPHGIRLPEKFPPIRMAANIPLAEIENVRALHGTIHKTVGKLGNGADGSHPADGVVRKHPVRYGVSLAATGFDVSHGDPLIGRDFSETRSNSKQKSRLAPSPGFKDNTHRRADLGRLLRIRQPAGFRVDLQYGYPIILLTCGNHPTP